jgi:hypothetical protein
MSTEQAAVKKIVTLYTCLGFASMVVSIIVMSTYLAYIALEGFAIVVPFLAGSLTVGGVWTCFSLLWAAERAKQSVSKS